MSDYTSPKTRIPSELPEFLALAKTFALRNFIIQTLPLKSVAEYSPSSLRGSDFPRPSEHFVVADYLVDNPVIAVDLGTTSQTYGRILGYSYGEHWLIANSLTEFAQRLTTKKEEAVWGVS